MGEFAEHVRAPVGRGHAPAGAATGAAGGAACGDLVRLSVVVADDQLVRGELGHVSRHGGRVFIVSAPVREVSRFDAVIRGVQVLQSPTILVIDRNHHARTLVGYTDRAEIGQSVSAAVAAR